MCNGGKGKGWLLQTKGGCRCCCSDDDDDGDDDDSSGGVISVVLVFDACCAHVPPVLHAHVCRCLLLMVSFQDKKKNSVVVTLSSRHTHSSNHCSHVATSP